MVKKQSKTKPHVDSHVQQTQFEQTGSRTSRFVDKWIRKLFPDLMCDDSGPCQKPVKKPTSEQRASNQPTPCVEHSATSIAPQQDFRAQQVEIDVSPSFSSCISASACAVKPQPCVQLHPKDELTVVTDPVGTPAKGNVIADALGVLLEELDEEVVQIQKEQEQMHARLQLMGSLQGMMASTPIHCANNINGSPRDTPASKTPRAMDGILTRLHKEQHRINAIIAKGTAKLEVLQYAKQEWLSMLNMMKGVTVDAQHAGPLQALIFKDTMGRINAFQERQAQQHPKASNSTDCSSNNNINISNTPSLQACNSPLAVATPTDAQISFSVTEKRVDATVPNQQRIVDVTASTTVNRTAHAQLPGSTASAKHPVGVSQTRGVLPTAEIVPCVEEMSDGSDSEQVFMTAQCNVINTATFNAMVKSRGGRNANTVANAGTPKLTDDDVHAKSYVADNDSTGPVTPLPMPAVRPGFMVTADKNDDAHQSSMPYSSFGGSDNHEDVMESAAFVSTCMTAARNAIFDRTSATRVTSMLRNDPSAYSGKATHQEFLQRLTAAAKEMNPTPSTPLAVTATTRQLPEAQPSTSRQTVQVPAIHSQATKVPGIQLNPVVTTNQPVDRQGRYGPTTASRQAVTDAVIPRQTKYAQAASDMPRTPPLQTLNVAASSTPFVVTLQQAQTAGATGIGNKHTSNHQYAWSTSSECDVDEADVSEEEETGSGGYFDVSKPLSACALPPPLHFRQLSLQNRVETARMGIDALTPRPVSVQTLAMKGPGTTQTRL